MDQRNDLPVTRRVAGQARRTDGPHHIREADLFRARGAGAHFILDPAHPGPSPFAVAIDAVEVEGPSGRPPPFLRSQFRQMRRVEEAVAVKVDHLYIAGAGSAYVVSLQPLRRPKALASGAFDHHPGLIRVGDQVRVAAIGGIAVLGDQRADHLHPFAGRLGAAGHDAGEVGIVRAGLILWRHRDQFVARGGPNIPHRDAVFVQSAIGQGCRDALVVGIADPDMAESF